MNGTLGDDAMHEYFGVRVRVRVRIRVRVRGEGEGQGFGLGLDARALLCRHARIGGVGARLG